MVFLEAILAQEGKEMLKGYKTYILAAVGILTVIGSWLAGDMGTQEAVRTIFEALLAAAVRHGIG